MGSSAVSLRTCMTCGDPLPVGAEVCPRDGAAADPLIGSTLGEYQVLRRVGGGGMGLVYEGVVPLIGKRVAIKVLKPEFATDGNQVRRLLEEARVVNAIRHRSIVDIFGFGQLPGDGRHYIVMEYLEGTSLDALAGRAPLPIDFVLFVLDEVSAALSAAHGVGVVHRDLKPSNIFVVGQQDGSRYVKLLDFGLAKQTLLPADRKLSAEAFIMGTPDYIAPEQALGEPVGPRSDLYALGVVAFEMLTGRLPFQAERVIDLMGQHVNELPPRPSLIESSIPAPVEDLVLALLSKRPEERPGSAEELRERLRQLAHDLASAVTRAKEAPPLPPEAPLSRVPAAVGEDHAPAESGARTLPELPPAPSLEIARSAVGPRHWAVVGAMAAVAFGVATWALWPRSHPGRRAAVEASPVRAPAAASASPLVTGATAGPADPSAELSVLPEPVEPIALPDRPAVASRPPGPRVAKPAAPARVVPRSSTGPRRVESPTHTELLQRIQTLERRLRASRELDEVADPTAGLLLKSAKKKLAAARDVTDRKAVAASLDAWERTYLAR